MNEDAFKQLKVGDKVRAVAQVRVHHTAHPTEPDGWHVYAEPGDAGVVVHAQVDHHPTVTFFKSGKSTCVNPDEVERLAERPVVVTRRFELDFGHRLMKHESKCRNPHGHRYVFEVGVVSTRDVGLGLDVVGRVIDFSVLKEKVGKWLDETFDHGFVVQEGDPLAPVILYDKSKLVVLDCPPTIENLVRVVGEGAAKVLVGEPVSVVRVRGYETPNCFADWEAP